MEQEKPGLARMTRRQFLAWTGGVVGVAAVAGIGVAILRRKAAQPRTPTTETVQLPTHPSPNPAYRAWIAPDGGLALWTHTKGKRFIGYRFNATGRAVWRQCDGTRSPLQIATAYARQTGRPEVEATKFVNRLLTLGLAVAGGYAVPAGDFPRPGPGDCYHHIAETDSSKA